MKVPKGIKVSEVRPGNGATAEVGKFALVHYDCYLPRGERCGTSRDQRFPLQLMVGQRLTFPAIAYGVPGMSVGGIRQVRVSPNITYYERKENPLLPPNTALRYEIELLRVADTWDKTYGAKPEELEEPKGNEDT